MRHRPLGEQQQQRRLHEALDAGADLPLAPADAAPGARPSAAGPPSGGGRAAPLVSSSGHRPTICQIHSLSKSTGGRRRGWNAIPSWDGPLGARPLAHRLALGLVVIALAVRLQGTPGVHWYWRLTFWWAGGGAGGRGPPRRRDLLRHVVGTELGGDQHDGRRRGLLPARRVGGRGARPGRGRVFVLRSAGLVAYAGLAIALRRGELHPGLRGRHDARDLWLWGRACARATRWRCRSSSPSWRAARPPRRAALPDDVTGLVGLDPTSLYHLAQIPGMVLFFLALAAAPQWLRRPARAGPVAAAR